MKLDKPRKFSNIFECFSDSRGYLNPLPLVGLEHELGVKPFIPAHQLMSFSTHKDTFRGFHFQRPPKLQAKIVLVHSGSVLDVVVPFEDPRESMVEEFVLEPGDVLYVPPDFAHGFVTLSSDVLLQYVLDGEFCAESYAGLNGVEYISRKISSNKLVVSDRDAGFEYSLVLDR